MSADAQKVWMSGIPVNWMNRQLHQPPNDFMDAFRPAAPWQQGLARIEGCAGGDLAERVARRVKDLGGVLDDMALSEISRSPDLSLDQVIIQSWQVYPMHTLPESQPGTGNFRLLQSERLSQR